MRSSSKNIIPGNSIALRCLGEVPGVGFRGFLDGHTQDGVVGLAPNTDPPFTGTRWVVVDNGDGNVLLKCLGQVPGPLFQGFLDGRTQNATVGLAPTWAPPFTGTRWRPADDGPGRVILQCLGDVQGVGFRGFLDGRTQNATLGLTPNTAPPFTGAHWEVQDFGRIDTQVFDSGFLTTNIAIGGAAHLVLRSNGDFTVNTHAHDSGFDNIDYAISAVLMTPAGIAITFQHSGHAEGTVAGLPPL